MNNVLKNNYTQWKSNIKTDPKWIPPIDSEFIPHILPILATIPLVKNDNGKISPKLTYANIPEKLNTPNGIITGEQVKSLIGFIAVARRSVLLPKITQGRIPKYGLYTPLVLYAHKLYNDIPYDSWDTTPNAYLHGFLGTTLYEAYTSAIDNGKPELNNIKKLREEALTFKSGVKKGQQDKVTAHRCNLQSLDQRNARDGTTVKKKYSKYAVMSFLQLWLCNAELRDTDAMILDLYNWGNIPKEYDAVVKVDTPEIVNKKTALDELWDIL